MASSSTGATTERSRKATTTQTTMNSRGMTLRSLAAAALKSARVAVYPPVLVCAPGTAASAARSRPRVSIAA